MIVWARIGGAIFNKDNSLVADKTGTALVPAGAGQKSSAIQGGWGVGIPKNTDPAKKPAAWLALTWITNKMVNKYEIQKYQIDPNRTSAFPHPDLPKPLPYL